MFVILFSNSSAVSTSIFHHFCPDFVMTKGVVWSIPSGRVSVGAETVHGIRSLSGAEAPAVVYAYANPGSSAVFISAGVVSYGFFMIEKTRQAIVG